MRNNKSVEPCNSKNETLNTLDGFIILKKKKEQIIDKKKVEKAQEKDKLFKITSNLKPNETVFQKKIKAYISILVSRIGGIDQTSTKLIKPYVLSSDVLLYLSDIKKWLKTIDKKNGVFDVALACFEFNLLTNVLIPILCQLNETKKPKLTPDLIVENKKISIACLDLIVILTWPIEKNSELSEIQKSQISLIKDSQLVYKKDILSYKNGLIFKSIFRIILPLMSKNKNDLNDKDNNVLQLVLFFIRNILFIQPTTFSLKSDSSKKISRSKKLPNNVILEDISINVILSIFKENRVFFFLLTFCCSLETIFDECIFSLTCLEIIYLLIKEVDSEKLIKTSSIYSTTSINNSNLDDPKNKNLKNQLTCELFNSLDVEKKKKRLQNLNTNTRHGRFGTLLSLKKFDSNSYSISGQKGLIDSNNIFQLFDKIKKWNDRVKYKYDSEKYIKSSNLLQVNSESILILTDFINDFLVGSCYNKLITLSSQIFSDFESISKINSYDIASFFFVIFWFIKYKRLSAISDSTNFSLTKKKNLIKDFAYINSSFDNVFFKLFLDYTKESFLKNDWNSMHVCILCFTEIILLSSFFIEIESKNLNNSLDFTDDDKKVQELGELVIRKLFSKYEFLMSILKVPQMIPNHSSIFLKNSIQMFNTIFKLTKILRNENICIYMQKKKKNQLDENDLETNNVVSLNNSVDIDHTLEKKLNYDEFESFFYQTSIISLYITFLYNYEEVSNEEIKSCLSFFHKVFFTRKDYNSLLRLDFMLLLSNLKFYINEDTSLKHQIDEFIYYYMKKIKSILFLFPNSIEILFKRFENNGYNFFLSNGKILHDDIFEKKNETIKIKSDLIFKNELTTDEKFKILINILLEKKKKTEINLIYDKLQEFLELKLMDNNAVFSWTLTPSFNSLLVKNVYLRLLMKISGFKLEYDTKFFCQSYDFVTHVDLLESINSIKHWLHEENKINLTSSEKANYFQKIPKNFGKLQCSKTNLSTLGSKKRCEDLDLLDQMEETINLKKKKKNIIKKSQLYNNSDEIINKKKELFFSSSEENEDQFSDDNFSLKMTSLKSSNSFTIIDKQKNDESSDSSSKNFTSNSKPFFSEISSKKKKRRIKSKLYLSDND